MTLKARTTPMETYFLALCNFFHTLWGSYLLDLLWRKQQYHLFQICLVIVIRIGFLQEGQAGLSLFNILHITHTHVVLLRVVGLCVSPKGGRGFWCCMVSWIGGGGGPGFTVAYFGLLLAILVQVDVQNISTYDYWQINLFTYLLIDIFLDVCNQLISMSILN